MVSRGARRLRLPAHEVEALARELRDRGVRYGTGRELLAHRIAHVLLTQLEAAGETCDDRTHDAVRRSAPVRKCVDEVWPKVDPKRLVFTLLADQELARNGFGSLSAAEMAAISWPKPPRGPGSAPWTRADQVLIDEAADLIERTPSIAHIVVDEAQDLSPMEARAIGRRCATGRRPCSATSRRARHRGRRPPGRRCVRPGETGRVGPRARRRLPGAEADPRLRVPPAALDRPWPGPGSVPARGPERACGRLLGAGNSARRWQPPARPPSAALARWR